MVKNISVIDKKKLALVETFDNSHPNRNYETGQPDFGTIIISYVADKKCVELKSLKFYLQSFRNEGIFYENVTNRILDDLVYMLKPRWMEVKGIYSRRGGLFSTVIATHGKKK